MTEELFMIPTRVHGMMDYLMGLLLIVAPWLFGFSDNAPATWVPFVLGIGVIAYSLITDYELGAMRVIPMGTHLMIDILGGIFLAVSPWLFGFADRVVWPHVVFGLLEVGTAVMTSRMPSGARTRHDRVAM
jgi:hypothetical protein